MTTISMEMKGTDKLMRSMAGRSKKLSSRKQTNAMAVTLVDRWIMKNFQTEGQLAMGGTGWKPLSPITIWHRRRKGGKIPGRVMILQDTGTMRQRWTHIADNDVAIIRSGVDYARSHQEGEGVPMRRILPLEKQIKPELMKIYGKFVSAAIR